MSPQPPPIIEFRVQRGNEPLADFGERLIPTLAWELLIDGEVVIAMNGEGHVYTDPMQKLIDTLNRYEWKPLRKRP